MEENRKAVLVGVNIDDSEFNRSMKELKSLVEACEIDPCEIITQNLDKVNTATYVGSGKIPEIKALLNAHQAEILAINNELSPSQIRNLEEELDCKVLDRTMVILQIFSRRAKTREAKLQVEVANLQYMLPRLIGSHLELEQQTGGVGTTNRGSGEKQLELNRRQIQDRISRFKSELSEAVNNRETQRRQRKKSGVPVVSLVGYTNAGKSTIMNSLLTMTNQPEDKKVFEKDMLFATLETSIRSIVLPDKKQFLLSDTVGFIDRLPTHLVKAFRSTLEEALDADLILVVIDASDPDYQSHLRVTNETLSEIGVKDIPIVHVYNKIDKVDINPYDENKNSLYISAKLGIGMEEFLKDIKSQIFSDFVHTQLLIPYKDSNIVSYLSDKAHIISTEYQGEGTFLDVELKNEDYNRLKNYCVEQ